MSEGYFKYLFKRSWQLPTIGYIRHLALGRKFWYRKQRIQMTASSSICSSSKARSSKRRHVQNQCAYIICLTDRCRTVQFKKVYPDSYFNKSIIKISSVQSEENCQLECYFHAACKSYNLGPPTEQGRVCELSSSRHIFHSDHLIKRSNFIYVPSVVSF